ncbi:hypothetical protein AB835_11530 [Candidatus Endobugula sertula]|uniref:Uncharacterized protein n=1 Tax=Candidatus Endobugula sertula TaxID=62101 RepID=A0A1D2QMZ5_9GAMM|nr:hypothetical protein AB835_11530 [Candidatus Endobugula sertula]
MQGKVNQTIKSENAAIKLFAGKRKDPFIFDADWFSKTVFDYCIDTAKGSNNMKYLNVLSIVLEVNSAEFSNTEGTGLLAIAGQITQREAPFKILDRVGRPEISNGHLVTQVGHQDLRDIYNEEKTFTLNPEHEARYRKRLQDNIRYYDSLDGNQDWTTPWEQSLINILINDYLVVDTTKPFNQHGYFEIENSLLRNQPNTRSGGRAPGDRAISTLMTTLINGGHGRAISDGIPFNNIATSFPYLANPNKAIIASIINTVAPHVIKPISLRKREDGQVSQECQ